MAIQLNVYEQHFWEYWSRLIRVFSNRRVRRHFYPNNMDELDNYFSITGFSSWDRRVYFGPVSIERLRITLLDDKGNILNLHGHDWSFTLIADQLYQY